MTFRLDLARSTSSITAPVFIRTRFAPPLVPAIADVEGDTILCTAEGPASLAVGTNGACPIPTHLGASINRISSNDLDSVRSAEASTSGCNLTF